MEESLTELSELVGTAGLEVAGSTYQKVFDFNSRTCIGSGKVSQIKNAMAALGCKTVIVDEELTPSQQVGGLEVSCDMHAYRLSILSRLGQPFHHPTNNPHTDDRPTHLTPHPTHTHTDEPGELVRRGEGGHQGA